MTGQGIAQLAGVSLATVSRVVNGTSNVSVEVRQKVLDAIRATNYRPCNAAKMLARQRYNCIGLISEIEHEDDYYSLSLIQGVSASVTKENLRLAMGFIRQLCQPAELLDLPILQSRSVDGLLVDLHVAMGDVGEVLARLDIPYVYVNPPTMRPYNAVMPDDLAIARRAVGYLHERGHRRIAYLPQDKFAIHCSQPLRMQGYHEAMTRHQLPVLPWWNEPLPAPDLKNPPPPGVMPPNEAEFRRRVKSWIFEHGCTAILGYNAVISAGLAVVCSDLGVKVPDQVSIMSCDFDPVLPLLPVRITSFHLNRRDMGRLAVEMLLKRIENPSLDIPTQLVVGALREGASVRNLEPGGLVAGSE